MIGSTPASALFWIAAVAFLAGLAAGAVCDVYVKYRRMRQRSAQREFNFRSEVDTERRNQRARW